MYRYQQTVFPKVPAKFVSRRTCTLVYTRFLWLPFEKPSAQANLSQVLITITKSFCCFVNRNNHYTELSHCRPLIAFSSGSLKANVAKVIIKLLSPLISSRPNNQKSLSSRLMRANLALYLSLSHVEEKLHNPRRTLQCIYQGKIEKAVKLAGLASIDNRTSRKGSGARS